MASKDVFMVDMPEGYDENDRKVWRDSIQEALDAILRDAHMEVESARMARDFPGLLGGRVG